MKFARRNRSVTDSGNRARSRAGKSRRTDDLLEALESRVLLSISAATVNWNGQALNAVAGEYIVKSSLPAQQLLSQMQTAGLHPTSIKSLASGIIGTDTYLVVDNSTPVSAVNWWGQRAAGIVTAIGPNLVVHASLLPNEFNSNNPNLWGLYNRGGLQVTDANGNITTGVAGADIGMANAWDLGTGSRNNIVAVLDTGVYITHPDLAANIWRNTGDQVADGVDNDNNGVIDDVNGANFSTVDANGAITPDNNVVDVDGHGTHVSGIIGAVGNNVNLGTAVGINWSVQIMPVKVLDDTGVGSAASIIAGLNYVQFMKQVKGYNIVAANLSLGGNFEGPLNGIADPTGVAQIFVSLQQLTNQGVIVTAAAGNDGSNNDQVPVFPADYVGNLFLSVAATNAADQLASFSNFGSRVQIAAPGEGIYSTVAPTENASGYDVFSGTSMDAPMVAGAVAFLTSIAPGASQSQIVQAILNGADQLPQLADKVVNGRRLNVFRSAEILLGNRPMVYNMEIFGGSKIAGWAVDPNLGTKSVQGVVIVDDSTQIPFSTTINRTDVNKVFFTDGRTAYPGTHGFNVDLTLAPGLHKVDVYLFDVSQFQGVITNPDGTFIRTPKLVGSTFVEGNRPPIGSLDTATSNQIAGWAWDPDSPNVPINVRIDVDGQTVAVVPANQFHSVAVGNQGFFYTPNLAAGAHRIDAYALDNFTGNPTLIGTKTGVGNREIVYIDRRVVDPNGNVGASTLTWDPTTKVLTGYVVDPDSPFEPVDIQVTIDAANGGRQLLEGIANLDDSVIGPGFIDQSGNNAHRFAITVPNLAPGNHEIRVYAFDKQTGAKTEMLYVPVRINQIPIGNLTTVNENIIEADIQDPNTPSEPVYYRLDIDGSIGHVALATTPRGNGFVTFTHTLEQLSPGAHSVTLQVLDSQSLQMRTLGTSNFNAQEVNQPRGTVDAPGVTYNNITGTARPNATQATNGTASTPSTVALLIYGFDPNFEDTTVRRAPVATLITIANLARTGNNATPTGYRFTRAQISTALADAGFSSGYFFGRVFVLPNKPAIPSGDPTIPPTPADPYTVDEVAAALPTSTWLGEGEIAYTNTNQQSGYFAEVNFVSLNGNATVPLNDEAPKLAIDINNAQYTIVNEPDLGIPGYITGSSFTFSVPTPHLPQIFNNSVHMQYFDFITGQLRNMNTGGTYLRNPKIIPSTPINNFVARRLIVTGNFLPQGNLDAASSSKIAGWVRDADLPGVPVKYRVDIDGTVGALLTASETRSDLPFYQPAQSGQTILADDDHGFTIDTPKLSAGTHLAKLWAIDPVSKQEVLLGQRAFTILDAAANLMPIGVVEVLTGNRIGGWAQDPTTPAYDVAIQVVVDGVQAGSLQPANITRTDLAQRNGTYVHGFDFAMPAVAAGIHRVEVYAIDSTDGSKKTLLKAGVVETGTHQIAGNIDVADLNTIQGWAREAANDTTSPVFRLDVNGVWFQTFTPAASPIAAEAAQGIRRFFYNTLPLGSSSVNTVSLYYIDPNTNVAVLLSSKVIAALKPTSGNVDSVSASLVQGWAQSATDPNAVVEVQILVDSVAVGTTPAGQPRGDLTGVRANHAFVFNMPQLAPGTHSVQVRFRDPVTGDFSLVTSTSVVVV
jgi:subtilisin family serine protease